MKQLNKKMLRITIQRWVICLSLLVGHSSLSTLQAQTFTQRIQNTQNGGKMTIHHSKAIDDLVNEGSVPPATVVKKQVSEKTVAEKTKENDEKTTKPAERNLSTPVRTHTDAAVDTLSKKPANTYKTTGYRVQVYAGGNSRKDRQTAERIGNELRMLYPTEAVYVHFKSPRWICRMGNFRTQEEALQVLQDIKKLGYTAATIVKGKITLQY